MISAAQERIKELESQVREISVAAEGYRAQRDAATNERDQLAAILNDVRTCDYRFTVEQLARHDAELLRRLAAEMIYTRYTSTEWAKGYAQSVSDIRNGLMAKADELERSHD